MYVYVIQYNTCVPAASPDDGLRFSPKDDAIPQRFFGGRKRRWGTLRNEDVPANNGRHVWKIGIQHGISQENAHQDIRISDDFTGILELGLRMGYRDIMQ